MTILSIFLWLADIVSAVKSISLVLAIVAAVFFLGFLVTVFSITNSEKQEFAKTYTRKLFAATIVFGLLALIIPSKSTIYMIIGVEVANSVVTNEYSKEIMLELKSVVIDKIKETSVKDGLSAAKDAKSLTQ